MANHHGPEYCKKTAMMNERYTTERVNAFSDAVFAVIITLMVLDLKKPSGANWHSLASLWPTLLSYVVSYLFIAIVWVNHHPRGHVCPRLPAGQYHLSYFCLGKFFRWQRECCA